MRLGIGKGVATALALTVLAAACGGEEGEEGEEDVRPQPAPSASAVPPVDPPEDVGQTILELTSANSDLSRFRELVEQLPAQGLVDTLNGDGPLTLFVPRNEAFEALPFELSDLSPEQLTTILSYHVIAGAELTSSMLEDGTSEDSLEGRVLSFGVAADGLVLNGLTTVTEANIEASNGVVHTIDALLIPPRFPLPATLADVVSYYPGLAKLLSALGDADGAGAGLAETLGEGNATYTVLAPTNSGFSEDLDASANVLQYHVLPAQKQDRGSLLAVDIITAANANGLGQATFPSLTGPRIVVSTDNKDLQVNNSNVIFEDLVTSNGTIHVIDQVLSPPEDLETIIRADPELSIFVEALMGTRAPEDSLAILSEGDTIGDSGLTVFAPTNAAFEAVGFTPGSDFSDFPEVLLYHLLDSQVDANAAARLSATENPLVRTVSGVDLANVFSTIEVSLTPAPALFLNGYAQVIATDIVASDGILHKIDAVVYPRLVERDLNLAEVLSAYPRFSALTDRLKERDLLETLMKDNLEFTIFAPTNRAFEAFGLAADGNDLDNVLLYHVVEGAVISNDFEFFLFPSFRTFIGSNVEISVRDRFVFLNDSVRVSSGDIVASNGVIHVIDSVLIPPKDP